MDDADKRYASLTESLRPGHKESNTMEGNSTVKQVTRRRANGRTSGLADGRTADRIRTHEQTSVKLQKRIESSRVQFALR